VIIAATGALLVVVCVLVASFNVYEKKMSVSIHRQIKVEDIIVQCRVILILLLSKVHKPMENTRAIMDLL